MEVTRVEFTSVKLKYKNKGCLYSVNCDVILDDCLCLKGIVLCCGKSGEGSYLIFPSKQDVYRSIRNLNKGTDVCYPKNPRDEFFGESNKSFEEFFHPVSKEFYVRLLDVIMVAFNKCISKEGDLLKAYYRP